MVLIGLSDTLSLAQSIGIVGTIILTLYFSTRQIRALSSDTETRVLNDLDEKFHRMTEIIMEDPSVAKVVSGIEADDYPKSYGVSPKEMAFSFYVLWMCSHAFAMRQRKVLDDNEWAGWLQWMRNCFRRGTIMDTWKQVEPGGRFNPAFQQFINKEIVATTNQ